MSKETYLLAIESSCDDTSAAVISDRTILSNVIANQKVHQSYGGVVPELASRAHQQNIVPVVKQALLDANITEKNLSAVAFTRGPGLMGSLLVGCSFTKSMSMALDIPLIEVNHLHAHILAHFIKTGNTESPKFPFLCLTVSGGHTQIVKLNDYFDYTVIGSTIDDAAGEAFDKIGKLFGLEYPAGPIIDKLAKDGNPKAFKFTHPKVKGYDYSFSGLKTAVLYFVQKQEKINPDFIKENLSDLCASVQATIVAILIKKITLAATATGINEIAIAGGVSANSLLRSEINNNTNNWNTYTLPLEYTTDNAAMIALVGQLKYEREMFAPITTSSLPRYPL
jgi:N6-L-threonylcarbamoyladenine synthase